MRKLLKRIVRRLLIAGGLDEVQRDQLALQGQMAAVLRDLEDVKSTMSELLQTFVGWIKEPGGVQEGQEESRILVDKKLLNQLPMTKSSVSDLRDTVTEMQEHVAALRQELTGKIDAARDLHCIVAIATLDKMGASAARLSRG